MWNEVNQGHKKRMSILKYGFLSYCKQCQGLKASIVYLYPKIS